MSALDQRDKVRAERWGGCLINSFGNRTLPNNVDCVLEISEDFIWSISSDDLPMIVNETDRALMSAPQPMSSESTLSSKFHRSLISSSASAWKKRKSGSDLGGQMQGGPAFPMSSVR